MKHRLCLVAIVAGVLSTSETMAASSHAGTGGSSYEDLLVLFREWRGFQQPRIAGGTRDQILAAYPYLEPEDIDEALQYAALLAEDETVELAR